MGKLNIYFFKTVPSIQEIIGTTGRHLTGNETVDYAASVEHAQSLISLID